MKIMISVFYNVPAGEGAAARAVRIAEAIGENHQVSLIPKSRQKNKVRNIGTWVTTVPRRAFEAIWWNLKLSFIVLRNKFNIVYCSSDYCGFAGLYLWSKIRKYRLIFEAHSIYSETFTELRYPRILIKICQFLERLIVKHADYVITLSPNALQYYQVYNKNIDLVSLFVDDDLFKPLSKKNREKDSKVIGLIGPFNEPRKMENLHFLYSNIDKFDKRIRFVIIGHCNEKIQNKRIEYTGYLGSIEDYIAQISHFDAVLVPEIMATSGPLNKIIEPMACSIPVFSTPKGIVGLYWIEPGRDILVFEVNEMVDKINELIFNNKLMGEVGKNARRIVEQHYSRKVNKEKLIGILESAGRGHSASS